MTTSQRFYIPFTQLFTNLGAIGAGWKIATYATGTTTPKATYADAGLTSANANPATGATTGNQVADENGRLGNMFVANSALYKAVLLDNNNVVIETADPVDPFAISIDTLNPRPAAYAGTTAGTSSAFTLVADPIFTSYSSSDIFEVTFHTTCAAAPTLQYVAGGAALNLVKNTGQGTVINLSAGDVAPGRYLVANNGTAVVVFNPRNTNIYAGTSPTLTIASGIVTITNGGASYLIATEAAAASDDLDTINGGAIGEIIFISSANSNVPTVKNGTGNILTGTGTDYSLVASPQSFIALQFNGTNWKELTRSKQPSFGSPTMPAESTAYLAATDGFLYGYAEGDTEIILYSDSSNPPTTVRSAAGNAGTLFAKKAVFCPVKRGDYYKFTDSDGGGTSAIVFFTPIQLV